MSYRVSRARREFEAQLDSALNELIPLYKLAHSRGCSSRLLAVYYVFAYSQMEVYIKSFIEDALATLSSATLALDKIPDLMLGYLIHKSENLAADYRRYGFDENEGAIIEKVAKSARKIASWSRGTATVALSDASDFLEKRKYPSPKNLPQLFRRLGIKQIWVMIGRAGKLNGELVLTSLNDLRAGIAHEGRVPPGFSLTDFRERVTQMRRFTAALDRGVATHFCSGPVPRAHWNRSMS